MKRNFRIISVMILILCMIPGIFAGCADPGKTDPTVTSKRDDGTEPVSTVEAVTEEPIDTYFIPDLKYSNKTFTVLCPGNGDNEWECKDFYAENDTDDPVISAVYRRQDLIEQTYGIKVEIVEDATRDSINNKVKTDILGGNSEYDLIMQVISKAYTLAQSNYLINLSNVPYLDLSSSAWDQSYLAQTSIGGQNYFATGEITTMDNDATWVMMFNKKLAVNYDLDVYSLVKNNEWTFDKLYELTKDFYQDYDTDGKVNEKDIFGITTTIDFIQGLFYAADCRIIRKNGEDIPYLDFNNERNSSVIDKMVKIYYAKNKITFDCHDFVSVNPSAHLIAQQMFEEDRALFYSEVMQCAIRLRDMDTDYGIIPLPKFDKNQENYTTHSVAGVTLCAMFSKAIENDTDRLNLAGMVTQALAVEGKNILTPAYYEKSLLAHGTRDAESYDMLPIIFANRTCDLGYMAEDSPIASLYSGMRTMVKKGSNTIASLARNSEKKVNKALDKMIEAFEKID